MSSAFSRARWHSEPPHWSIEDGRLAATTGDKTDFWRQTYYGFVRDDGHALLVPASGEFTAALAFEGDYRELYDQAGLMLRANAENWIKFGIEWTDGAAHLSCVVTRGISDWSAQTFELSGPLSLRATRLKDAVLLQYRNRDGAWQMARLAPLAYDFDQLSVGPYLCSPERAGFQAIFHAFEIGPPNVAGLHE